MSDKDDADDPAPYYRRHVFMCTNLRPDGHPRGCCAAKDAEKLRSYLKNQAKKFGLDDMRINTAGCLDRCELGPTMVIYPEGVWYAYKDRADLDEILSVHLKDGKRVTRLQLRPGDDPPKVE